jgi:dephospho-CoA kinase
MSAWPGKFVIGLTGNIATGKSVIRKMLEHLGAYGIDADGLAHRAIARGAPGYNAVLDTFGHWILGPDGQVERPKLGRLVFADADALGSLEKIVHPLVRQAVEILITHSKHKVVVIEAIKLLESGLSEACDAIWVAYAPEEIQLKRLMEKRKMGRQEAKFRISAQPPQESRVARADLVIRNEKSFENTWKQVLSAWKETVPDLRTAPLREIVPRGEMVVQRARPSQASELAALITRLSNESRHLSRNDVMEAFGEKAYLLLEMNRKSVGLLGWQVENLVARTNEIYLDTGLPVAEAMEALLEEVELASRDLQCEASLLFISEEFAEQKAVWEKLGYKASTIDQLGVRAWQEAARESMPDGTTMYFKRLREDRVLRPV